MSDREKVIKALTCCVFPVSKGFPYQSHIADEGCEVDECPYKGDCDQMLLDTLELLKEQDKTIQSLMEEKERLLSERIAELQHNIDALHATMQDTILVNNAIEQRKGG